jgi:hypothetical protein
MYLYIYTQFYKYTYIYIYAYMDYTYLVGDMDPSIIVYYVDISRIYEPTRYATGSQVPQGSP